jgi:hypothetical protein
MDSVGVWTGRAGPRRIEDENQDEKEEERAEFGPVWNGWKQGSTAEEATDPR